MKDIQIEFHLKGLCAYGNFSNIHKTHKLQIFAYKIG